MPIERTIMNTFPTTAIRFRTHPKTPFGRTQFSKRTPIECSVHYVLRWWILGGGGGEVVSGTHLIRAQLVMLDT